MSPAFSRMTKPMPCFCSAIAIPRPENPVPMMTARVCTGFWALASGTVSVCVTTSVTVVRSFYPGLSRVGVSRRLLAAATGDADTRYPGYRFGRVLSMAAAVVNAAARSARGRLDRRHVVNRQVRVHRDAQRLGGADDYAHHDGRQVRDELLTRHQ